MSDKDQKIIFSRNLNKLLKENGKTQKEVADAIGVNQQTMNTWCTGTSIPRMGKVQRLADYFGIKKSDLVDDKQSKENDYSELITKFHSLTTKNQQTILSMIDVLLSQQASEKESNVLVG